MEEKGNRRDVSQVNQWMCDCDGGVIIIIFSYRSWVVVLWQVLACGAWDRIQSKENCCRTSETHQHSPTKMCDVSALLILCHYNFQHAHSTTQELPSILIQISFMKCKMLPSELSKNLDLGKMRFEIDLVSISIFVNSCSQCHLPPLKSIDKDQLAMCSRVTFIIILNSLLSRL